jgi:hypothetical protein
MEIKNLEHIYTGSTANSLKSRKRGKRKQENEDVFNTEWECRWPVFSWVSLSENQPTLTIAILA